LPGKTNKVIVIIFLTVLSIAAAENEKPGNFTDIYKKWKNGPPAEPGFFPIAVWLQSVEDAPAYKTAGINTFVALREGPKPGEIEKLGAAGMYLVCEQNKTALLKKDDRTIIAWKGAEEPDNALVPVYGKKNNICTKPAVVIAGYKDIIYRDNSRPVLANFGQGLVIDNYEGRGPGADINDYREYFKGGDIISFSVFPVAGRGSENLLWYQGKGLERIAEFGGADKIKWNFIETASIREPIKKPSSLDIKAEVWISIVHGSKGIVYYCQQFKPNYNPRALLNDREIFTAVSGINRQIKEMAPVINSPDISGLTVTSGRNEATIKTVMKIYKEDIYIFAVPVRNGKTTGTFIINGIKNENTAEVLGEARSVEISAKGVFKDSFQSWQVHLYKIKKN